MLANATFARTLSSDAIGPREARKLQSREKAQHPPVIRGSPTSLSRWTSKERNKETKRKKKQSIVRREQSRVRRESQSSIVMGFRVKKKLVGSRRAWSLHLLTPGISWRDWRQSAVGRHLAVVSLQSSLRPTYSPSVDVCASYLVRYVECTLSPSPSPSPFSLLYISPQLPLTLRFFFPPPPLLVHVWMNDCQYLRICIFVSSPRTAHLHNLQKALDAIMPP